MRRIRVLGLLGLLSAALVLTGAAPAAAASTDDRFFVPPPNPGAVRQIAQLLSRGRVGDARLLAKMIATPQAVWL